jgi:hypothetical protein
MGTSEHSDAKIKLGEFINNSSISQSEKDFWLDLTGYITSEVADDVVNFLTTFPDKTEWAMGTVKKRVELLKKNNPALAQSLMAEDVNELKKLSE